MDLNPIGEPPTPFARWCPSCGIWITRRRRSFDDAFDVPFGRLRCSVCRTALIRPMVRQPTTKPGELRPGVMPEFADPRDREAQVGAQTLAALRARLRA